MSIIFVIIKYFIINNYEVKFYDANHEEKIVNQNTKNIHHYLLDNGLYYKIEKKNQIITPFDFIDNYYLTKKITDYKWSKKIPAPYVDNYLSPMRIALEKYENYKFYFHNKFETKLDSLNQLSSITRTEVANSILDELSKSFIYDEEIIFTRYPNLKTLLESGRGDCYTVSYINVMALRAAGIPSAVDYCPAWSGKVGGHTEFVVLNDNDVFESNVNTIHKHGLERAPKVYRLMSTTNEDLLQFKNIEIHKDLSFLKDLCYMDVTDQHAQVEDVEVNDISVDAQNKILYACVMSTKEWHPVAAAVVKESNVIFKNLGKGIRYKFGFFENDAFTFIK